MNSRPLHRWMRHLALAATLALALVPSLGRLAGQPTMPMHAMHADAAAPTNSDVMGDAAHTAHSGKTSGAKNPLATAHGHAATRDAGDLRPLADNGHHGSDDDCAYCPLLASTTALPAPGLPAALPVERDAVRVRAIRTPTLDRHPTGLGSRGPPITA